MTQVKLGGANPYVAPEPGKPHVKVETMLFSIVQPNPGYEVAYNDWYERDHQFDGGTSGEGWFSNRRWVSTRRLKALRFPADGAFEDLSIGALLQMYWRQEGYAHSSEKWAGDQWVWLNERNRIFSERKHFHSTSYWHLSTLANEGERVPLELALQHPFKGLVALMVEDGCADGKGDRAAAVAALEEVAKSGLIGEDIPLLSTWEVLRELGQPVKRPPGTMVRGTLDSLLQIAFLRDDPEALWSRITDHAAKVSEQTGSRVTFASGFIPTIPGTTTYMDEL